MVPTEIIKELIEIRDCIGIFSSSTIKSMLDNLIAEIKET